MNRFLLILLVFLSFITPAQAETDADMLFAKKVLAITRTDNFNDYMTLWHPTCGLTEKSAALVMACERIASCSQPSPEQRDLHIRRNLVGIAQIVDMHVSPISQLDQSGLPRDFADKVTQTLDYFSLKPDSYIWANVTHPQYGRQVAEIAYAIHDGDKIYIVDGNCMDRPAPAPVLSPAARARQMRTMNAR